MSLAHVPYSPQRIEVAEVVSSRYADNVRPSSWDLRKPGVDLIRTSEGRTIKLASDGGQSPPQPGWVILLTGGDANAGLTWTLYGMPRTFH